MFCLLRVVGVMLIMASAHELQLGSKAHAADKMVTRLAFSPNGKILAAGRLDKTIELTNAESGKVIVLKGHTDGVISVAFGPDGGTIASASEDGTVILWRAATGKVLFTLKGHTGAVAAVAISPDGKTVASAGEDGQVKLWEAATGKERATLKGHTSWVLTVAFSPDGKTLASGGMGDEFVAPGKLILWDVENGKERVTLKGHSEAVYCVAFSPDGVSLASGSGDDTIRLWDLKTAKARTTIRCRNSTGTLAFSPDGTMLVSARGLTLFDDSPGAVMLWDAKTGEALSVLGRGKVRSVVFRPDGKIVAWNNDQHVEQWEVEQVKRARATHDSGLGLLAMTFSPDGKSLVLGSPVRGEVSPLQGDVRYSHVLVSWDVATGKSTELKGHTQSVCCVAFSPDGKTLASGARGYSNSRILITNVATGKGRRIFLRENGKAPEVQPEVVCIAFSPDGKTLASGYSDSVIRLWDAQTDKAFTPLKGHDQSVRSIAFSPDGKTLASGGEDKTIKLWDTATGELRHTLVADGQVLSVTYSPDGKTLASGDSTGAIKFWDAATGKVRATLNGHSHAVPSVAFSPDGKMLASGSTSIRDTGEIKIWDVATGKELETMKGQHIAQVLSVSFSPDGKTLASGSADGTIKLWDLPRPK